MNETYSDVPSISTDNNKGEEIGRSNLTDKEIDRKVEQQITVALASIKREEAPREEDKESDIIMIIPRQDRFFVISTNSPYTDIESTIKC